MPNYRNFNRAANKPNRVARQNDVTGKRVFRGTTRIFMQSTNASQGGVEGFFGFSIDLSQLPGSDYVRDNFEQYQVKKIKVMMKPSPATLDVPTDIAQSISYQNCVYSLMNGTNAESFIDYDTSVAPGNYNELLTRPNLKIRGLQPNNWTMVADFQPRTLSNPSGASTAPSITWGPDKWLSTDNFSVPFRGLRGRVSNRAPVLDGQDQVACVDVIFSVDVHMRGPKNGTATTVAHTDINFDLLADALEEPASIVSKEF
jgi:hypothetical protein